MTRFEDGPAHGKTLMLKRAPQLLRVVVNNDGEIDALDQLDDTPGADETLFVYQLKPGTEPGFCHILIRDRKGSGFYTSAEYIFHSQPSDADIRETDNWRTWCRANVDKTPA